MVFSGHATIVAAAAHLARPLILLLLLLPPRVHTLAVVGAVFVAHIAAFSAITILIKQQQQAVRDLNSMGGCLRPESVCLRACTCLRTTNCTLQNRKENV